MQETFAPEPWQVPVPLLCELEGTCLSTMLGEATVPPPVYFLYNIFYATYIQKKYWNNLIYILKMQIHYETLFSNFFCVRCIKNIL